MRIYNLCRLAPKQRSVLSLHFHDDCPKLWSAQLLKVLQSLPLVEVLPLDCSKSNRLTGTHNQRVKQGPGLEFVISGEYDISGGRVLAPGSSL